MPYYTVTDYQHVRADLIICGSTLLPIAAILRTMHSKPYHMHHYKELYRLCAIAYDAAVHKLSHTHTCPHYILNQTTRTSAM